MRRKKLAALLTLLVMLQAGCATYKTQYVAFRPPEAFANQQQVDGVAIGGEAYAEKDLAENAFGFNIRNSGLLPVQLVLNNKSGSTLELIPSQTFLVDDKGGYWPVLPNRVAVERVDAYTESGSIGRGAGKGALLGATAGTILGAAIGIVSGQNVGSALGKGAAVGAAGGALLGGSKEGSSQDRGYRIADDIREKGLEGKAIPTDHLANGFLFFPGEATSAKEVRLQFLERESGKKQTVILKLK